MLFLSVGILLLAQQCTCKVYFSHLDYLITRYQLELNRARWSLAYAFKKNRDIVDSYENCTCNNSTAFGEMLYMQIRESNASHALDISLFDDVSSTLWAILALAENKHAKNGSKVITVYNNWNSKKDMVNDFANKYAPNIIIEPIEMSHHLKSSLELHSQPIDIVAITGIYTARQLEIITNNLLVSLSDSRPIFKPALAVIFNPMMSNHRNGFDGTLSHIRTHKITKEEHNSGNQNLTFVPVTIRENPLMHWLNNSKQHSIDIMHFHSKASLQSLRHLRVQRLHEMKSSTLFSLKNTNGNECTFALATIVSKPRITIIVPVLRPYLLPELYKSIRFNLIEELIVVYSPRAKVYPNMLPLHNDHGNSKIREVINTVPGIYGNPERTFGLANIPKDRVGWVYFLDDDNVMHNNAFTMMQTKGVVNVLFFGMEHCPNAKHPMNVPSQCKAGFVDTGNAIFSAQAVNNLTWVHDVIGDGIFCEQVCALDMSIVTFHPILASYHNGLRCSVEKELV